VKGYEKNVKSFADVQKKIFILFCGPSKIFIYPWVNSSTQIELCRMD
jgi:hypothetical protein